MRTAHIKITLFVLFLLAPVAALLALGPVEGYGRAQPEFPPLGKLLLGKKGRFDQFGDAVLERSIVQRLAVQLRGRVGYQLVGYVDTDKVVSGEDGWLFYRPEFGGGRCRDEAEMATTLRRLATLVGVGRAAGIDMFVSVSPDKSTIYPERLSQVMRGYWRCRAENVAALRRLIRRWAPMVIDHAEPMLEEKAHHPDRALFFMTDTHWSRYGAGLALRQLLAEVFPNAVLPPPQLSGETAWKETDLRRMLLLSPEEEFALLDAAADAELKSISRDPADYRTVIIRDSFYGTISAQLESIFPNGRVMHRVADEASIAAEIAAADRLIMNSIERSLISPDVYGLAKWDGTIATAILARNMARANDCAGFVRAETTRNGSDADNGTLVAIPAGSPEQLPCLRLAPADSGSGTLTIALPDPETGAFEAGREITYRFAPGQPAIGIILPSDAAGAQVRLQVDAGEIRTVEVGAIARPRLASALQP